MINRGQHAMYPATMINYKTLSRNVKYPKKFEEIRDQRLVFKAAKDSRQGPFKIVLNSTFGASKDKYNALFDPLQANNTCINGQLLLIDLLEKLEIAFGNKLQLIQVNTDGILVKLEDEFLYPDYVAVCKEWEERTMFDLEHDRYCKVIQKDVNNYIIIDDKGDVKRKGAVVKKQSPIDYDLPIINEAVVQLAVNGTPIQHTINSCNELIKFQKVIKSTSKFDGMEHNGKFIKEKVCRVFATRDTRQGPITKLKEGRTFKIGDTPDNVVICNQNIIGKEVPAALDRNWYIDLAVKRAVAFGLIEEVE